MNLYVYNPNVRNPTCYKSKANAMKTKCRYNFPQPLVSETKFDIKIKLLYIKEMTNGILSTSKCNHDLKFIAKFDKDNKSFII
jgi:hypothetical protein